MITSIFFGVFMALIAERFVRPAVDRMAASIWGSPQAARAVQAGAGAMSTGASSAAADNVGAKRT